LLLFPAFAQVRLATHNLTGESVAVKLFDKTKKLSEYELKHFYREATVLQRVQSKHAAAAFQFLDAEFVYALVFELIETDLLDDVTKSGPYNEDKVGGWW
jgi:MAP/microtubule affinity-regulating kinase